MSYTCKNCGTVIMEDDKNMCNEYLCINELPLKQRPIEPCCTFENPEAWSEIAGWEAERADRAEAQRDELLDKLMSEHCAVNNLTSPIMSVNHRKIFPNCGVCSIIAKIKETL